MLRIYWPTQETKHFPNSTKYDYKSLTYIMVLFILTNYFTFIYKREVDIGQYSGGCAICCSVGAVSLIKSEINEHTCHINALIRYILWL